MGVREVTTFVSVISIRISSSLTRGSQRLPSVLHGSESGDGLRLRDLWEDLILCEHSNLRGYLPSCIEVRAVTASISVIFVRISSSANTRISEVTCRPLWEWEQWRPSSLWSLWESHPLQTRGSQRLPAVLYGGESSDGLRLRGLYNDLILRKHADLRGYLPSCMGVRAVTASVSVISVRISSFVTTRISEVTCRPV